MGGGLLLSTVFLHMLNEIRDSLSLAAKFGYIPQDNQYPFAELLICMGRSNKT